MEEGFVKINRKLTKWEWYTDANTARVFLHCLIMANWKDARFRGKEVPRGSFVTSLPSLCKELKLSVQQVRTAIDHLKSTGEITVTTHPHFRIITVNKYNEFQTDNRQNNRQLTGNQQATNRQLTAIEEYKEYKNIKKGKKGAPPSGKNSGVGGADLEALARIEEAYLDEVRRDPE
jgi:hypothetical protein